MFTNNKRAGSRFSPTKHYIPTYCAWGPRDKLIYLARGKPNLRVYPPLLGFLVAQVPSLSAWRTPRAPAPIPPQHLCVIFRALGPSSLAHNTEDIMITMPGRRFLDQTFFEHLLTKLRKYTHSRQTEQRQLYFLLHRYLEMLKCQFVIYIDIYVEAVRHARLKKNSHR